ncbi:hypothetical protein C0Q70_00275 [Pomacea canaliculata]|uniref:Uncharacterized protein n=1 Tax=Pomacea canaliculata TaxID=400727 RepID=A0A2T7PW70_POMCA|nr:hypothetical protein C0Q70_00275 [Pomacea canaliculata]
MCVYDHRHLFARLTLSTLLVSDVCCSLRPAVPAHHRGLKRKRTLMMAWITRPYTLSNFYPTSPPFLPASFLLGAASGPMWTAQGLYISASSMDFVATSKMGMHEALSKFNGFFFACYESTQIVGNVLASLVLMQGYLQTHLTRRSASCGAVFFPPLRLLLRVRRKLHEPFRTARTEDFVHLDGNVPGLRYRGCLAHSFFFIVLLVIACHSCRAHHGVQVVGSSYEAYGVLRGPGGWHEHVVCALLGRYVMLAIAGVVRHQHRHHHAALEPVGSSSLFLHASLCVGHRGGVMQAQLSCELC